MTQIEYAQKGIITPQIKHVAQAEQRSEQFIAERVAAGTVVIPANINHKNLIPCGIGRELKTKINANLGNSTLSSCPGAEKSKLAIALHYGADTVMDLSTGGEITSIRQAILEQSTAPLGTVPVYEIVARYGNNDFAADKILSVIREQAEQGVDYMTIHAGLLQKYVPLALKRKLGIVSRGGALLAAWMQENKKENPFYEAFDEILAICQKYDVTLSLGDGLRPGCLADASDEAQFAELDTLGELVSRCRAAKVQAMVEGPGHVPLDQIQENMERERKVCGDAPFYILGPVVIDCAPGYDHFVAGMGGMMGAYYGAAMLCYVTPKEHLGLPNADDVRRGVVAFKIAAHAADVALHKPGCRDRDDAISDARAKFDWEKQFELALDPEWARELRQQALQESSAPNQHGSEYCTMCGPDFCSVRLSARLKKGLS
ncbi:MAG: phosphomethylpyrimidine synthase ThiC [Lentisphaerae bacterium]|nr:phosphomethylpyrimidine synthase ThiC [Lentisphaerota bacterium]MBR2871886.1 phosphomethylpyrimidine synthase ThiC [Lentisphaeria bacterium]